MIKTRTLIRPLEGFFYGAIIGGIYGSLHDLVTYQLGKEYYENYKFPQFQFWDVGQPTWQFVVLIGFLATWGMGALAGLSIVRATPLHSMKTAWRGIYFKGVAWILSVPILFALIAWGTGPDRGEDLVGRIHLASYLGAPFGIIWGIIKVRQILRRHTDLVDSSAS